MFNPDQGRADPAPADQPVVHVTEQDFDTLSLLARAAPPSPGASLLLRELERAVVVDRADGDFVRLGSQVRYQDLESGQARTLEVALPGQASIDDNRISILTPVGAALLGLRPGQVFTWETGGRLRTLKVLAVQPPA